LIMNVLLERTFRKNKEINCRQKNFKFSTMGSDFKLGILRVQSGLC